MNLTRNFKLFSSEINQTNPGQTFQFPLLFSAFSEMSFRILNLARSCLIFSVLCRKTKKIAKLTGISTIFNRSFICWKYRTAGSTYLLSSVKQTICIWFTILLNASIFPYLEGFSVYMPVFHSYFLRILLGCFELAFFVDKLALKTINSATKSLFRKIYSGNVGVGSESLHTVLCVAQSSEFMFIN